ncbi:AMP-binding protein [Variovorax sp. YR216]|uniref:AMP-binding protein n=1 Tax=Variovorax sp. YR216 TaxID=1882828 RepID=UPI00089B7C24|nr:AMP-binding protein [Variovorax sp. YR216]SEB24362.1 1-acyl-sn-glycerol-3-phosphate acyltransferases [Variovorax sp. YR216]
MQDLIAAQRLSSGPQALLDLTGRMLGELRAGATVPVELDDDLERTLGIDSLARMELMLRLEQAYDVHMPEEAVQQARTPRDLWRALSAATPREGATLAAPPPRAVSACPGVAHFSTHAQTLIEVIEANARGATERPQITLIGGAVPVVRTHAELLRRGGTVAAALQAEGLRPGQSVALMLPTSLAFFETFTGILIAGGVPVPIYPPFRASGIEDHLKRQARILDNAQAVLLIGDERTRLAASMLRLAAPGLRRVLAVESLTVEVGTPQPVLRGPRDTALLQYTSGSTGQPKGVLLTHANLLANIRAMGAMLEVDAQDVFVSWLPLYHDMGLIGAWMGSLYHNIPLVLMAPQDFLSRPSRWLRALHEHGGTLSAAPNFAYEILATKVPDDELAGLDLSRWRVAINGAEPVHAQTLQRFARRFAACGFDERAMMPVYGLAESAVGLAFRPLREAPRIDCIDRHQLHRAGRAEPVPGDAPQAMRVVACGLPLPGHEIRVVDEGGAEVPERVEGRIQFRGPSATSGYFRNPEATRLLFDGSWLDTGDVGYVAQGEIHLTSRAKDLIIRGGDNLHPYELEEAIGALPGVRRGCVAVFAAADPVSASERVVVLAETRETESARKAVLRARIGELAIALLGVPADDIVLAGAHVVPKTSSGKIRRAACRELYEGGLLDASTRPVAIQLARLSLSAAARRLHAPFSRFARALLAAWWWTLFGLGTLCGVATAALPSLSWRKGAARAIARGMLWASGLPLRVEGASRVPGGPTVVVANHASYLDWLVLTALLPASARFVAKEELSRHGAMRWLLERVGTRFVARGDPRRGVEDTRVLVQAAQGGESLVFFPEGTLRREPGLMPFHMGAFVVSAESGLPVLPVSLRGTRNVLREGSWRPRREAISLVIHPALKPQGRDWQAALQLRDAARNAIAADCAEPVLRVADGALATAVP